MTDTYKKSECKKIGSGPFWEAPDGTVCVEQPDMSEYLTPEAVKRVVEGNAFASMLAAKAAKKQR